jgi:hypothetical protein
VFAWRSGSEVMKNVKDSEEQRYEVLYKNSIDRGDLMV